MLTLQNPDISSLLTVGSDPGLRWLLVVGPKCQIHQFLACEDPSPRCLHSTIV